MAKPKVLIIDDERDMVKILGRRLTIEGFEFLYAQTGKDGLMTAQEEKPDLIILDVMLPKMSGFEVCEKLKRNPLTQEIPIIICTGKGYKGDTEIFRELGAEVYIEKIESMSVLIEHVNRLLGRNRKDSSSE